MAIDFPNSPTQNQEFTVGDKTWIYDGQKWILKTAPVLLDLDSVSHIGFDTAANWNTDIAELAWDDGEGTLAIGLKGGNVTLQVGQENVALCYNGTGSPIPDGSVVYISGAQGQRPRITLAQANTETTSSKVLGITTEPIANGAEGFVATFGIVNGVDTSAFTAGQALWLSPTVAGGLTATKPVAPNHLVFIGYAISINASSGRIFVNPQNGYELDELHDISMSTKETGDLIVYNNSTGLWENTKELTGTYSMDTLDLIETSITSASTGIGSVAPIVIDSFDSTLYRTVEYLLQFSQGTSYATTKFLIIHDDINTSITEFATLSIGSEINYTIDAAFNGSNIEILVSCPTASTTTVYVKSFRTMFDK